MKWLALILMLIMVGCGSNDSTSGDVTARMTTSNVDPVTGEPIDIGYGKNLYKATIPPGAETLPTISRSIGQVRVDYTINNQTAMALENYSYEIGIEDPGELTPPEWICGVYYPKFDGTGRVGGPGPAIWKIYAFQDPLPDCPGTITQETIDSYISICLNNYDSTIDCYNLLYDIEYREAGDGYRKINGGLGIINSSEITSGFAAMGSGTYAIKPDNHAYIIVNDELGNEVFKKDYVIEIVP